MLGRDHYWIVKEQAREAGQEPPPAEAHVDERTIHMPSPSYWPIVIAFGVTWIAGGILTYYALSVVGGLIAFVGVLGWGNEPASAQSDH